MATYITEDGYVYYENVPEEKRALFPNLREGGGVVIQTVTGDEPVIEGWADTRYVCGVVETLSITPPDSGIIDILFQSGETPTVLTVPETVLFPDWFDPTSLQANTIYEFNIMDGVYCTVTFWYPPASEDADETDDTDEQTDEQEEVIEEEVDTEEVEDEQEEEQPSEENEVI